MSLRIYKQINVLLLITVYLFIVLTHVLFLPHQPPNSTKRQSSYNSIFKRKLETAGMLAFSSMHRTDKTVLNKNESITGLVVKLAGIFLILFFVFRKGSRSKIPVPLSFLNNYSPYPPFRVSLRI